MELPLISGVDAQIGIRCAGGSAGLYIRFLKRYPQDDTFAQLGHALREGYADEAFRCAHTLKGLSDQLGILAISAPAKTLCELLRPRSPDALGEALDLYGKMLPTYQKIVHDIRSLP